MAELGNVYTLETAAEKLSVHPNTIKKFVFDRQLKAYKLGRQWRIMESDLLEFMQGLPSNFGGETVEDELRDSAE